MSAIKARFAVIDSKEKERLEQLRDELQHLLDTAT
jgi:hypothetical protein